MRILKYIFLLILLFSIGLAVFVATQKSDFEVTKTKVVNIPRNIVFSYVNDYRNWPGWVRFDGKMKPEFPTRTSGKGGSFSWEGSTNDGSVTTLFTKENDSIAQQMEWNGLPAIIYWKFEDAGGKTKITLTAKGKIGFMPKIKAALKGGANRIMETIFENSLASLDRTLDHEINIYNIKVDGLVEKTGNYYLKQSIVSTIDNMPRNMRIMLSNLTHFFKKNNIPTAGKPFTLYDYYDTSKKLVKFSVCIPIRDEINTSAGSDVSSGKFESFRAVKTTLTGDYSHLREAWDKTYAYIRTNHIDKTDGKSIEWYTLGKEDGKGPSQWVTEIYVPVKDASAPAPIVQPSATTLAQLKPAAAKPEPSKPEDNISIP